MPDASKCKLVKTEFTTPYTRYNHPWPKQRFPTPRSLPLDFPWYRWPRHFSITSHHTEMLPLRVNFIIADPWKRAGCKSINRFMALYGNDCRKPWIGPVPQKDRGRTTKTTGNSIIADYRDRGSSVRNVSRGLLSNYSWRVSNGTLDIGENSMSGATLIESMVTLLFTMYVDSMFAKRIRNSLEPRTLIN